MTPEVWRFFLIDFVKGGDRLYGGEYIVYILECADDTYYTGMTNDLQHRLQRHQQGKGAKYTRGRLPVSLKYVESGADLSWARRRERQIQRMCRMEKERLIQEAGKGIEDPEKL
jgi:putative endonuclease